MKSIADLHLAPRLRVSAAVSLLPPVCLQGVRRDSVFFLTSYATSKLSSDARRITRTFCVLRHKTRRFRSRYRDTVNPCPTWGILSSKTAGSANLHCRNLISYRIYGDTSARPWEVAQHIKPEIYKSDIYL